MLGIRRVRAEYMQACGVLKPREQFLHEQIRMAGCMAGRSTGKMRLRGSVEGRAHTVSTRRDELVWRPPDLVLDAREQNCYGLQRGSALGAILN